MRAWRQRGNGAAQQILVGGELLEQALAADGAYNGHQISRLHFIVNEVCEHLAGVHQILKSDGQIINHKGKDALNVSFSQPWRRSRRRRFFSHPSRRPALSRFNKLEEVYELLLAALG